MQKLQQQNDTLQQQVSTLQRDIQRATTVRAQQVLLHFPHYRASYTYSTYSIYPTYST